MAFTFGTVGQNSSSNITTLAVSVSASTNDAVLVAVRWTTGPAGATRTISTATCSGETVTILTDSFIECTSNWRLQWVKIDKVASGGTKSVSITLSGQTDAMFLEGLAITGAKQSGSAVGEIEAGGAAFGTAEISLTTTAVDSAILAMADANSSITVRSGFTGITFANTTTTTGKAFYDDDVDAIGAKTVGVDNSSGVWAISAVEILIDAVTDVSEALSGSASTGGHGTQAPSIAVPL